MTETPAQRARRLGLIQAPESVQARAKRLGLDAAPKSELPDTSAGGAIQPDEEPGYGHRLVSTVLNAAQGIPGMEAVEAAAGAVGSKFTGSPLSYHESLQALREDTGKIPKGRKFAGKVLGGVATLPFLPAAPWKAGAALGGSERLLSADADQSLEGRLGRTALGAAGGAVLGKGADLAVTGVRAALAPTTAKTLEELVSKRAKSAAPLYQKALTEGAERTPTPAVQRVISRPDIAEIIGELQQTRRFANTTADDPEMLDAVYKVLSDRAALAKRQAEAVTPSRPNIGRFRSQDIATAQEQLLRAMQTPGRITKPPMMLDVPGSRMDIPPTVTEAPAIVTAQSSHPDIRTAARAFWDKQAVAAARNEGTVEQQMARRALERNSAERSFEPLRGAPPGPRQFVVPGASIETAPVRVQIAPAETKELPPFMPSYREAVSDYAEKSRILDAAKRGHDATRSRLNRNLPMAKSLAKTSLESFDEFLANASPEERRAAAQGILGATKSAFGQSFKKSGQRALRNAPMLLRKTGTDEQRTIDDLIKVSLLAGKSY